MRKHNGLFSPIFGPFSPNSRGIAKKTLDNDEILFKNNSYQYFIHLLSVPGSIFDPGATKIPGAKYEKYHCPDIHTPWPRGHYSPPLERSGANKRIFNTKKRKETTQWADIKDLTGLIRTVVPPVADVMVAEAADTKAAEERAEVRAEVRSKLDNIALASWISRKAELGIGT